MVRSLRVWAVRYEHSDSVPLRSIQSWTHRLDAPQYQRTPGARQRDIGQIRAVAIRQISRHAALVDLPVAIELEELNRCSILDDEGDRHTS